MLDGLAFQEALFDRTPTLLAIASIQADLHVLPPQERLRSQMQSSGPATTSAQPLGDCNLHGAGQQVLPEPKRRQTGLAQAKVLHLSLLCKLLSGSNN